MRLIGLVVLCLCMYARASVTFDNSAQGVQNSLSNTEYQLSFAAPKSDLLTEDDVAALFNALSASDRSLIGTQIENALESFRDVIINGNGDIPVLDPFVIDHIGPLLFTASGVRVSGNVRNLRAEGLKWYIVNHVNFNIIRLTLGLQITVPWIVVTGDYDARASIALINHNSGGNFRVFVNRLVVTVDVALGVNIREGGHLFLRTLNIDIDIHDTHIQIHGLFGSSLLNSFINTFVQSLTQEVIQNQLENVSTTISEQLFEVIDNVLRDFTLDDLLG